MHWKSVLAVDSNCAPEGKLAKQVKHHFGNKSAMGCVEEEFELEEVEFVETRANPNPGAANPMLLPRFVPVLHLLVKPLPLSPQLPSLLL